MLSMMAGFGGYGSPKSIREKEIVREREFVFNLSSLELSKVHMGGPALDFPPPTICSESIPSGLRHSIRNSAKLQMFSPCVIHGNKSYQPIRMSFPTQCPHVHVCRLHDMKH